jgi:rhodanese-related sulfurtransferase
MFTRLLLGLVAALTLASAPSSAVDSRPDTPTTINNARIISVDEARNLLDTKAARFFDTRNALNFGKGHVPGATLLAYKEKSEFAADFDATQDSFDLSKLPADKDATIVIYSHGPKGWKSYKAAVLSATAGYRNVLWMREGFAGWSAQGLAVD